MLATEVWAEISELYRQRHDFDRAIEAWEQTIRLGYRGAPHPRAGIAELLILAGRRQEGDALYDQLLENHPDDVWLRNSAALTYLDVDDFATALQWIDTGLELTMSQGDRLGLLGQLCDMRDRTLHALGRSENDDLSRRAAAFVAPPRSTSADTHRSWGEAEPSTEPCANCGARPDLIGWIPAAPQGWATPPPHSAANTQAVSAKVPRNAPCKCGSGKKAKKCCADSPLSSSDSGERICSTKRARREPESGGFLELAQTSAFDR